MTSQQDDVLAMSDYSSGEFSGFSPDSEVDNPQNLPRSRRLLVLKRKSLSVQKRKMYNSRRPKLRTRMKFDLVRV